MKASQKNNAMQTPIVAAAYPELIPRILNTSNQLNFDRFFNTMYLRDNV